MKPKTAIRIRRERALLRWDDERRYANDPQCPTCGRRRRWTGPGGVRIRRGHRFLVPVRTEWRGLDYGGGKQRNHPLSKPIRLNWPVKVRRGGGWTRGRTWAQCPDAFHEYWPEEKPEPRQSNGIRRLMRANAPYKRKVKARRHKSDQSYQRR